MQHLDKGLSKHRSEHCWDEGVGARSVFRGQMRHCLEGIAGWDIVMQKHTTEKKHSPTTGISHHKLQLHTSFWARAHEEESAISCESEAPSSKGVGEGARVGPRREAAKPWLLKKRTCPFLFQGSPGKSLVINTAVLLQSGFHPFNWGQLAALGKPRKCTVSINSLTGHLYSSNRSRAPFPVVVEATGGVLRARCPSFFSF